LAKTPANQAGLGASSPLSVKVIIPSAFQAGFPPREALMKAFIGCDIFRDEIEWVLSRHPEIQASGQWLQAGLHNDMNILEERLGQALSQEEEKGTEDLGCHLTALKIEDAARFCTYLNGNVAERLVDKVPLPMGFTISATKSFILMRASR
jgi:hypothetical protein